ncbi:SpoIIIAH-like family protein [Paenibacillus donghaensis]|uniref:Stage III sporulation protein AH n=1 Tax=Paenibacillus donghaensis TaxID=414771 RepID=A0A2Z2KL10_9BACL|nr:SpoIIIAH-like family protein [Paenibacillus donghaensis]ASA23129.1 hypothetical protein B9T62_21385 [Paenibacillus donghaensis]
MNGKRQTIWLVSMLSLMVVLSAYYLFTEDSGATLPKDTAGTMQVDQLKNTAGADLVSAGDKGVVVNEVVTEGKVAADTAAVADENNTAAVIEDESKVADTATDPAAEDQTAAGSDNSAKDSKDTVATDNTATDKVSKDTAVKDTAVQETKDKETAPVTADKTPAKDDKAILDEVASQSVSASSMFNNYLYERQQKNLEEYNDLMALMNDMDKSPAENAVAQEKLMNLEEKESKIDGVEVQLQKTYGEAIVKEEAGDSYKVVVLSDKLDVKQAVGIVDLVMKELSVSQNKVSVQYVSEQ